MPNFQEWFRAQVDAGNYTQGAPVTDEMIAAYMAPVLADATERGRQEERDNRDVRRKRVLEPAREMAAMAEALPTVDGTNRTQLRDWVEGMERYSSRTQVDEETYLRIVSTKLRGQLHELSKPFWDNGKGGTDLIKEIRRKYLGAASNLELQEEALSIRQAAGESLSAFTQRYWNAYRRCYKQDNAFDLDAALQRFPRRVNDRAVMDRLLDANAKTVEAAAPPEAGPPSRAARDPAPPGSAPPVPGSPPVPWPASRRRRYASA